MNSWSVPSATRRSAARPAASMATTSATTATQQGWILSSGFASPRHPETPLILNEMMSRGKSVPGGACGFWGACGAGISTGMFVSIISKSTPLANEPFALSHQMTAISLGEIGHIGGPRCCKRDSFLSILAAVDFVKEHFGVEMERPEIICRYSSKNNQCIGRRCPFSPANHQQPLTTHLP